MTTATVAHTSMTSARVNARRFSLIETVKQMAALRAERRALAGLDAAALKDIGISFAEAQTEAARPAWDAPNHWHN